MNHGRLWRTALLALPLAALPLADAQAQATKGPALALCPSDARRLDAYMQALCDGEAALQAGDPGAAADRFRVAAALPRADASNELAWAGLAVAHCRSRDFDAGRQWAEHFAQARQLWLGELDCAATPEDPRARLSPFVRSRMCGGPLAADYAALRGNPHSLQATDLRRRLARIDEVIGDACAAPAAAAAKTQTATGAESPSKKAASKRGSRSKKASKSG